MKLSDVLYKVSIRSINGSIDIDVKDIQIDSRKIKKSSLFIGVKGSAADGHLFIDKATDAGAAVIVCEVLPAEKKDGKRNDEKRKLAGEDKPITPWDVIE